MFGWHVHTGKCWLQFIKYTWGIYVLYHIVQICPPGLQSGVCLL